MLSNRLLWHDVRHQPESFHKSKHITNADVKCVFSSLLPVSPSCCRYYPDGSHLVLINLPCFLFWTTVFLTAFDISWVYLPVNPGGGIFGCGSVRRWELLDLHFLNIVYCTDSSAQSFSTGGFRHADGMKKQTSIVLVTPDNTFTWILIMLFESCSLLNTLRIQEL